MNIKTELLLKNQTLKIKKFVKLNKGLKNNESRDDKNNEDSCVYCQDSYDTSKLHNRKLNLF